MAKKSTNKKAAASAALVARLRGHRAWLFVSIFLIVMLVAAIVMSILTHGYTDMSALGLGINEKEQPGVEATTPSEDVFILNPINSQMVKLYATALPSTDGKKSVQITATVLPENATDKTVDWEVTFTDPENEWAKGKNATDYVSATPSEDGSTTCLIQGIKIFQAQIKVVVTSRNNPEATAFCTIDCPTKYEFADVVAKDNTMSEGPEYNCTIQQNLTVQKGTFDQTNFSASLSVTQKGRTLLKNLLGQYSKYLNNDIAQQLAKDFEDSSKMKFEYSGNQSDPHITGSKPCIRLTLGNAGLFAKTEQENPEKDNNLLWGVNPSSSTVASKFDMEKGLYSFLGLSDEQIGALKATEKNALNSILKGVFEALQQPDQTFLELTFSYSSEYYNNSYTMRADNFSNVTLPTYVDSVELPSPNYTFVF